MTKSPKPKSWRDHLWIHPAAELFPLMSESELRQLGEDIKKNGLRYPIILWRENKGAKTYLLDGRNRLDALESIGVQIVDEHGELQHWSFRDGDPYDLVLSFNVHRRHLTAEQKRELIAKILKVKPAASNVTIAKQAKADDKTVAKVRRRLESTSEIPRLTKTVGADGKSRSNPKKPAKRAPAAKTDPIGKPPVRYSEVSATSVPRCSSSEVSVEQRRAEMAQLASASDDLVDQAIRLVEQMTADQRRGFIGRLWEKGLLTEFTPPGDDSIPEFLLRERP